MANLADRTNSAPFLVGFLKWLRDVFAIKLVPRVSHIDDNLAPDEMDERRNRIKLVQIDVLLRDVFLNARLIIVSTLFFVCLGFIYLSTSTPKYEISVRVIAIPEWLRTQPTVSTSLTNLLAGSQSSLFNLLAETLSIKKIYQDMDVALNARQHVFSAQWDPQTRMWHAPQGILGWPHAILGDLKELAGYPRTDIPTIDDLRQNVISRISLSSSSNNTMTIEMKSSNITFDVKMLRFVLDQADQVVRAQMVRYVDDTTAGLEFQIAKTNETMLRSALIDQAATQLTKKAELQNNKIMALDLNSIEVSDMPLYPSFKGVLIAAFLFGLLLPIGIIFLRELLN